MGSFCKTVQLQAHGFGQVCGSIVMASASAENLRFAVPVDKTYAHQLYVINLLCVIQWRPNGFGVILIFKVNAGIFFESVN